MVTSARLAFTRRGLEPPMLDIIYIVMGLTAFGVFGGYVYGLRAI
jgi:hypothetical protein